MPYGENRKRSSLRKRDRKPVMIANCIHKRLVEYNQISGVQIKKMVQAAILDFLDKDAEEQVESMNRAFVTVIEEMSRDGYEGNIT